MGLVGICYCLQEASEPRVEHDVEASEAEGSEYDSDAGKCVGEAPTAENACSLGTSKFSEDRLLEKLKENQDGRVDHGEDAQLELDSLFEELKSEGLKELEGKLASSW